MQQEGWNDYFYFGVWTNSSGHFLYRINGSQAFKRNLPDDFPVRDVILDCGFLPFASQSEGKASLVHVDTGVSQWTIVSFYDRTGDSRPGSNSAFILRGHFSLDEAVAMGFNLFPAIATRINFPVRLALSHRVINR